MKLVDKYLLREYLTHVTYCLLLFCMIYVIYDLFARLTSFLDAKTSLLTILYYYACLMTPTLEFLVPASLLLATLYTLWQLTRNNEFTAMRASGISLFRILMPFLGVGLAFTLITAGIKETFGPHASQWADSFSPGESLDSTNNIYRDVAYFNKITRRQWLIGQIDPRIPTRLVNVRVKQERPDGTVLEEITAPRAEWVNDQWWFFGMVMQSYDEHENPLKQAKPKGTELTQPKPLGHVTEQPFDFLNEVKPAEYLTSIELARFIATHKDLSKRTLAQKRFDLHSRLAMPWACVIVTLFGIPAGAKGGRQSALTGIFLAMSFFFGFYALTHVGMFLAKREIVAPWIGAWLSNIIFLAAGILMMFRLR